MVTGLRLDSCPVKDFNMENMSLQSELLNMHKHTLLVQYSVI